MKNILIVSHGAALGGSPISALNIGRYIDKSSYRPIFVFGENGPIVDIARKEGFDVYVVKKRGLLSVPMMLDFYKIIKKESIALVHLNTLTSYYKYPAMVAKLLKREVVWFVRENPQERRCLKLANYINNFSDKIVTVSYDTAKHMTYAKPDKLMTIHNGINIDFGDKIDKSKSYKVLKLDSNSTYLTTIASLEPRKGILELIESFNAIKNRLDKNTKLLIVGKDRTTKQEYLSQIKTKIDSYELQNRVVLYGESRDIKEIMSISKIFILNAYWEGLSRVLLEAMICSKPIVASSNGGNKEQVLEGVNGYTFDAGNIEELSKKLLQALKSDLDALGEKSKQLAVEKFDIKDTTTKIENLYKSLI